MKQGLGHGLILRPHHILGLFPSGEMQPRLRTCQVRCSPP